MRPALSLDSVLRAAAGPARAEQLIARPPAWVDALGLLISSASEEGGLSDEGTTAFVDKVVRITGERLRADHHFGAHPEIGARPLAVRVAVAGLARSGTTLLHRLLCCDPDVCFLPTWQAFNPVPSGPVGVPDNRRTETLAMIDGMRRTQPDAFRVHPLDADAPEEEVFLLQHSFASMLFAMPCPLPSYMAWLSGTAHHAAYRYAFDLLRLNEWAGGDRSGRPRVMKSPQFVLDLQVIIDLVADAVIVQTHRDPVDLVGSYCSVYAGSRRRGVSHVDLHALGAERLEHLARMAANAAAARAAAPDPSRFVDIDYDDLLTAPLDAVAAIYERVGEPLGRPAREAMEAWLQANPQGAAGRHDYRLSDYGLDRAAIEARFAAHADSERR